MPDDGVVDVLEGLLLPLLEGQGPGHVEHLPLSFGAHGRDPGDGGLHRIVMPVDAEQQGFEAREGQLEELHLEGDVGGWGDRAIALHLVEAPRGVPVVRLRVDPRLLADEDQAGAGTREPQGRALAEGLEDPVELPSDPFELLRVQRKVRVAETLLEERAAEAGHGGAGRVAALPHLVAEAREAVVDGLADHEPDLVLGRDGTRMDVVDHLVGRERPDLHPPAPRRPAPVRGGRAERGGHLTQEKYPPL